MSVATNENKPQRTAIKLPTGKDQSKMAQVRQRGMCLIFVWNPNVLYLAAKILFCIRVAQLKNDEVNPTTRK